MTHFKPKIITGFAATGLAWVLAACAGGSDLTPEAEPRAEVDQKANGVKAELFSKEAFTTEGKPTKTIETPWGTKEIYDPTQSYEINQVFRKWYEENQFSIIDYTEFLGRSAEWEVFIEAEALQALDLKRAGCESVVQSNGHLESYNQVSKGGLKPITKLLYFTKDCGHLHNYGASELSECEFNNNSTIPRSKARRLAFDIRVRGEQTLEAPLIWDAENSGVQISKLQKERGDYTIIDNGIKNEVLGMSSGKSSSRQLSNIFSQTCEKWRGVKPHEQISYTGKGGFTVFLLDFYPEDPLAPKEFQTLAYKNYLEENGGD